MGRGPCSGGCGRGDGVAGSQGDSDGCAGSWLRGRGWAFADLKGRCAWKWGLAGLLCNILGVAAAAIAPDLKKKREREKE